jgi:hypothetical protein
MTSQGFNSGLKLMARQTPFWCEIDILFIVVAVKYCSLGAGVN